MTTDCLENDYSMMMMKRRRRRRWIKRMVALKMHQQRVAVESLTKVFEEFGEKKKIERLEVIQQT